MEQKQWAFKLFKVFSFSKRKILHRIPRVSLAPNSKQYICLFLQTKTNNPK